MLRIATDLAEWADLGLVSCQQQRKASSMNKKLMLLAVGTLAALAFTALPGAASAEETALKCLGAGSCTYTIAGGEGSFSLSNGDTLYCTSVTGNGQITGLNAERESTTNTTQLLFHGCKETNTIFHFACTSPGFPSGTMTTNVTVGHSVRLNSSEAPNEAGILITNVNMTMTCAGGFAATTKTGNLIGEMEKKCGAESRGREIKGEFRSPGHGMQTPKVYTGKTYDLEAATNHSGGGAYSTVGLIGTGTITFNQEVELTCKA
jgi:hypothetical protein